MNKVCIFNNDGFSVLHFRKRLIQDLIISGYHVTVLVPKSKYDNELRSLGIDVVNIKMDRFINPISDLILLFRLYSFLRNESFDLIHNMTIKPNIYGGLIAKLVGIKRIVSLVPGAGFIFSDDADFFRKILQIVLIRLYRFSMRYTDKVWFQNSEDKKDFIDNKIINPSQAVVIVSSGVDIQKFSMSNLNQDEVDQWKYQLAIEDNHQIMMMVTARVIRSKGVCEFLKAARHFRSVDHAKKFILIAPTENNSFDGLKNEIQYTSKLGNFHHHSAFIDDIHNVIALADVMILPSYYREGVPRALLEALSLGKPIITTDHIGCRETVLDGQNGFLVKPRDSDDLICKIQKITETNSIIEKYGVSSRELAEEKFSDEEVSKAVIKELYNHKIL
tara:strand:+ start:3571 stop:4740 length:1170 start_codon:yes stop_codon:yes gene_type:complete